MVDRYPRRGAGARLSRLRAPRADGAARMECDNAAVSYDRVRCGACNAVDADEWVEGTASCGNCGAGLSPPAAEPTGGDVVIYPVLKWSWGPCQRCGSLHGEQGGPEDDHCWDCGAELLPVKRRTVADGFPFPDGRGSAEQQPGGGRRGLQLGSHAVCVGDAGVRLVGADAFTRLQVTAVRATGDVDVAAIHDGTVWAAVRRNGLIDLS